MGGGCTGSRAGCWRTSRGVLGDNPAVWEKETVLVMHTACYLATPAADRARLLEAATRDDEGAAGA